MEPPQCPKLSTINGHRGQGMDDDRDWTEEKLIPLGMALVGAVAGLIFYHLLGSQVFHNDIIPLWRQAAAVFVGVSTISFLITLDRMRWWWSIAFAVAWGAVMAFVGWMTASYNFVPNIFEFPFLSGIAAVLVAAPLFQASRDEGAARFPIDRIHRHVWSDVVIGLFALLFTGLCFIVAFLIASLFRLIGIDALKELFEEGWFAWMLAGAAFGGTVGILREREALLGTVRKLVMAILAVLAPVVAVALWAFFLALPFTGLEKFWDSGVPPTPILLLGAFGAFALTNVIIGDGTEEKQPSKVMRGFAMALSAAILPLALLAALSMGQRIGQYGWTPERLWGVIAIVVVVVTGLANWFALAKGRVTFADILRPLQVKIALGVVALAVFLALPIVDFGSISAKSQLARLQSGKVKPADFDWAAMAFDFGSSGRNALKSLDVTSQPAAIRQAAAKALDIKNRYELAGEAPSPAADPKNIRVVGNDIKLDEALLRAIGSDRNCSSNLRCTVVRLDDQRLVLLTQSTSNNYVWVTQVMPEIDPISKAADASAEAKADILSAPVEVRTVIRRQVFVDGKPVGEVFDGGSGE